MGGNARKIDEVIDRQAVEQQLQFLSDALARIKDQIMAMPAIGANYKNASGADLKQATNDLADTQQKLAEAVKLVATETQKALQVQKEYNDLISKIKKNTDDHSNSTKAATTRMQGMTENGKLLAKALSDVKKQLEDGIAAGKLSEQQQQKLSQQTEVLTSLVNQQQKGFASLTAEIRSGERALQTMREAGLQNSAEFREMQLSVAEARREFNNFAKEQRILSAEAPTIQALTTVARGLGGAYAAGAGAAALFGDENGKVEKELRKLIAVMTLLKGLQEFNEAWQQKNAIATAVSVLWNKALTAVYGEEAVAAATAAEATGALYAVMSGGLLLVIGLVVGAVIGLVSETKNLINANEKAAESAIKIADADKKVVDSSKEVQEAYKALNEERNKANQEELSAAEKAGKSQYEIMAIKKRIAEENRKAANEAIGYNGITKQSIGEAGAAWQMAAENAAGYAQQIAFLTKNGKDVPEALQKQAEAAEKQAATFKASFEFQKGIFESRDKAAQESSEIEIEKAKLSAEEQRKYNLLVAKDKAEAAIHANEVILANENSTQKQRLAASKKITEEQIQLIKAEASIKKSEPGVTPAGRALIEKEASDAVAKAKIEGQEKLQKINHDYAKRDRDAYFAIRNAQIEMAKNANDAILQNDSSTFAEKMRAKTREIKDETELENIRYAKQRSQEGLTQKEIQALGTEHYTKLTAITSKGLSDLQKLRGEAAKKQEEDDKKYNEGYLAKINGENSRQMAELNSLYTSGAISIEKYNAAKLKLENAGQIRVINAEIAALEQQLRVTTDLTEKDIIRAKLKDKDAQLSKVKVKQTDEETAANKKKTDKAVSFEQDAATAITAIVDGQHEMELNRIQKEIDANTVQKNTEIENVNQSTLSVQQKAARIAIINATAQANEERLNKKKRDEQIKQAEFDKAMEAFKLGVKLIIDTADLNWVAAAADAAGLIALAAKPIPKYQFGTDNHPGGPAIVGEVGQEKINLPDGSSFLSPNGPTLLNLPKNAQVIPHDETNRLMLNDMMQRQASALMGSPDVVNELRTMREMQVWQTGKLIKALGQKQPVKVTVINNGDLNNYIKQQVYE